MQRSQVCCVYHKHTLISTKNHNSPNVLFKKRASLHLSSSLLQYSMRFTGDTIIIIFCRHLTQSVSVVLVFHICGNIWFTFSVTLRLELRSQIFVKFWTISDFCSFRLSQGVSIVSCVVMADKIISFHFYKPINQFHHGRRRRPSVVLHLIVLLIFSACWSFHISMASSIYFGTKSSCLSNSILTS